MATEELSIKDVSGASVRNTFYRAPVSESHLAILFPGLRYTCDMPVAYYVGALLRELGADLLEVRCEYKKLPSEPVEAFATRLQDNASLAVRAGLKAGRYTRLTLIGFSLGSWAAVAAETDLQSEIADLSVATVALSPPLGIERAAAAFLAAPPGRRLFAVGGEDPHRIPSVLEELGGQPGIDVEVFDGGDHHFLRQGDIRRSLKILERVLDAVRSFLGASSNAGAGPGQERHAT